MNRINTWLSHGRITQWSMYVISSVAEGNDRKERTTFLDVPPNRFGCRGDDNERTNERERTSKPPPPTLCATGKGGGRSGATTSTRLHLDCIILACSFHFKVLQKSIFHTNGKLGKIQKNGAKEANEFIRFANTGYGMKSHVLRI